MNCETCHRRIGISDGDDGSPPVDLGRCAAPGGFECRAVAQAVAEYRRENDTLRSNCDYLSSENASLSSQVDSMAMRIESLADELAKPEDARMREVLGALDGRAVIFDSAAERVAKLLDELDEFIGRAGDAERECERLQKMLDVCSIVHEHNVKLTSERDRLRKMFDDAGQGEHNVLALVDHYQKSAIESNDAARQCYGFLKRLGKGGTIVSSSALTPHQIAIANGADRILVDSDGYGYVYVPGPRFDCQSEYDLGRRDGRKDVGKYSNAIGRIESAIGIAGAAPLEETVKAVESLVLRADTDSKAKAAWERLANERGRAWDMLCAVRELLAQNGCDCDCDCDAESHDDDCERCLACRIADAVDK